MTSATLCRQLWVIIDAEAAPGWHPNVDQIWSVGKMIVELISDISVAFICLVPFQVDITYSR